MKIRLTPELKDQIERFAKANGRSMNAEIVHRLEQSFSSLSSDALDNPDVRAIIKFILQQIETNMVDVSYIPDDHPIVYGAKRMK